MRHRSRSSSVTTSRPRAPAAVSSGSMGLGATTSCLGSCKATRVRDWRGPILTELTLNDRTGRPGETRSVDRPAERASGAWRGLVGVAILLAALEAFCRPGYAVQSA